MLLIRLAIADDHALVRAGLRQLFALAGDLVVVGEAGNGAELLELLDGVAPTLDLVVLDLTMPELSGPELLAHVHGLYPRLPILVLSMHIEPQIARLALAAGAAGYLTKDSEPEMLLAAVRKLAAGGRFIDAALAEQMVLERAGTAVHRSHETLTRRELEILRLLASGLSVNAIAVQLAISHKTVSTHKARLMQKMGFRSNAQLVRYGLIQRLALA